MKSLAPPMLVALLMLLGAAAYLVVELAQGRWSGFSQGTPTVSLPRPADLDKQQPTAGGRTEGKAITIRERLADNGKGTAASLASGHGEEPALKSRRAPPPVPTAAPPPRPFPDAADVQVGLDRMKLVAAFGKPSMRTTAVERDHLVETYVYTNHDRSTATYVLLRDARVVAAETSVY